jgi:hypothetical protein
VRRLVTCALVVPVAAAAGAVIGLFASILFMITFQNCCMRLGARYPVDNVQVFLISNYPAF